jgi:hypothetical protein
MTAAGSSAGLSQETVEFVRKPLRVREHSSRTLDQRLFLRFPRLAAASSRLIARMPPTSRVRQVAVWRNARLGLEAYNRRDLDAVVIACHPEFEWCPDRSWVEAGLMEPCYRGAEGYRRYVATTAEVFAGEVHVKPLELIDLGERMVVLADGPDARSGQRCRAHRGVGARLDTEGRKGRPPPGVLRPSRSARGPWGCGCKRRVSMALGLLQARAESPVRLAIFSEPL